MAAFARTHPELCKIRFTCGVDKDDELVSYVDASYGVHDHGRSHTGGLITMGGGPVFTKSVKQKLNCKSSTEAELIALSDMLSPILWMRNLLESLGRKPSKVSVLEDNMSVIALVNKGRPTAERTRHIRLRYFFISDYIKRGEVGISHCDTSSMLADGFTKPWTCDSFEANAPKVHGLAGVVKE